MKYHYMLLMSKLSAIKKKWANDGFVHLEGVS